MITGKYTQPFNKSSIILLACISALALSGCDPDFYVSQEPVLEQFQHKSPETIDKEAQEAFENGEYNKAISYFNAIIKLYPQYKNIELVQFDLINCHESRWELDVVMQKIDKFIADYPNSRCLNSLRAKKEVVKRKEIVNYNQHREVLGGIRRGNNALLHKRIQQMDSKLNQLSSVQRPTISAFDKHLLTQ